MMKRIEVGLTIFLILAIRLFTAQTITIPVLYGQSTTAVESKITSEDIKGATLAMEEINSRGGLLGKKIELLDCRVESIDLEEIKQLMERIEGVEDLFAVIGANTSGLSLYFAPKFQEKGILMISPISTNPDVTKVGDFIFRACFTDPFQGKVMARFALDELKAQTAVILTKITSDFSVGLSQFFVEEFEKSGTILAQETYLGEAYDFSDILLSVKELNPDVVFVPGHGSDSGLIIKQAYNMGIDVPFLGGDGWGKGLLGFSTIEAAEGHYFSNHWHKDSENEKSAAFVLRYHQKYGEGLIASSSALAYDAMMLLEEAVKMAGSFSPEAVRDSMNQIRNFEGVTGTYDFTAGRDPFNKEAVILKYHNGEMIYHSTVSQ